MPRSASAGTSGMRPPGAEEERSPADDALERSLSDLDRRRVG